MPDNSIQNSGGYVSPFQRLQPGRSDASAVTQRRPAARPTPIPGRESRSGDSVTISSEARRMAGDPAAAERSQETANPLTGDLTDEERREVQQLRRRDGEVRRHEAAHVAAGGQYVRSGAQLDYSTGPDGRRYATGGEVSIDVSSARTPQATIQKASVVRRAALAPADPSPQDRRVAAQASQMAAKARRELAAERSEEGSERSEAASAVSATEPEIPFQSFVEDDDGPQKNAGPIPDTGQRDFFFTA